MWKRRLAYRSLAVLIGLAPFLIAEIICRISGIGLAVDSTDSFVEFVEIRPLFELDAQQAIYSIPDTRQGFFRPDSFAAHKEDNEFRIFCLGGSTVQGRPYEIETSFTTWLELSLKAADASKKWQVVNCGGVSYASYRLVPILEEVLQYDADLVIIYTGHNEFLEDRTYTAAKESPRWLKQAHRWSSNFQSYRALRSTWFTQTKPSTVIPKLPTEVAARLDDSKGMKEYHRDVAWRDSIIQHYSHNLERMADLAYYNGVPVIFIEPVCNLRNCPPFKYQQSNGLTDLEEKNARLLWNFAQQTDLSLEEKVALLNRCLAIDPQNAGMMYQLGKCFEALERFPEARDWLIRAKEEDVCPLRILEPMKDKLRQVATDHRVPLIRIEQWFQAHSPGGIPGNETFVDHVHPTIAGHKMIAIRITKTIERLGFLSLAATWEKDRADRFFSHYETLDPLYFERAQPRLAGLRLWATGRAGQLPFLEKDDEPMSARAPKQ